MGWGTEKAGRPYGARWSVTPPCAKSLTVILRREPTIRQGGDDMKTLSILAAAATICVAGCYDQFARSDAIEAEYQRETQRINAEYLATSQRLAEESQACLAAISTLKIGSEVEVTQTLPCREDKINTTETGDGTLDQWVYRTTIGDAYLYFRNGLLVAKQL